MIKPERNSNIELLRIIAMMGVVALHYVHGGIGGVENYAEYPNFTWFFVQGARSIAVPLVNVFIIITAYFMIHVKKFSFRKPVDLLCIVFFYGIILYIISVLLGYSAFKITALFQSIFPFFYGEQWFIKTYIILMLLVPYINKALSAISLEDYRKLIMIQLLLFSVWYSLGLSAPIIDDGYGIINFITLYIIGGYIGRFENECSFLRKINYVKAIVGYAVCVIFTAISSYFINPFGYAFISNVLGAVMLFIAIIKMPEHNNVFINKLSSTAFDVFFIHRYFFSILGLSKIAGSRWVFVHIIVTVIICYLAGFITGSIRKLVFKNSVNKLLDSSVKLNRIYIE